MNYNPTVQKCFSAFKMQFFPLVGLCKLMVNKLVSKYLKQRYMTLIYGNRTKILTQINTKKVNIHLVAILLLNFVQQFQLLRVFKSFTVDVNKLHLEIILTSSLKGLLS